MNDDKVTYSKDRSGEGYLLRGPATLLVEGETVTVTLKSGSTKTERVGPRRAGPFEDGMALHDKAGGSAPRGAQPIRSCPHCGADTNQPPTVSGSPTDEGAIPF